MFERQTPAEALATLLEAERGAVLSGAIARLPEFAREKERLLARLRLAPPPQAALAPLMAGARRNERLLAAATQGLRAALRRLEAKPQAERPALRTYGRDGAATCLGAPRPGINQRA